MVAHKIENLKRPGQSVETTLSEHCDPPQYYVSAKEVKLRLEGKSQKRFLIAYKSVTSPTNERTMIISFLPICGVAHSMSVVFLGVTQNELWACFVANLNSLVLDYVANQKVGGVNLSYFFVRQFPILPPEAYTPADIAYIAPRVLELVYTAYDLRPFAEDMGYPGEPFRWDEVRRAQLRAELDATYARLYGLTRDELRYILDPKEVHGEDFPGETFRVLKDKEIRLYGEYRTRRLVLEAWDGLEGVEVNSYTGKQVDELRETSKPFSVTSEPPAPAVKPENRSIVKPENVKPVKPENLTPENLKPETQPMLSDFGLYKCPLCEKMVMGYEKERHSAEVHGGKSVEWVKVREGCLQIFRAKCGRTLKAETVLKFIA